VSITIAGAHEHIWQLQAVLLEDGVDVRELGCTCGAVDYR